MSSPKISRKKSLRNKISTYREPFSKINQKERVPRVKNIFSGINKQTSQVLRENSLNHEISVDFSDTTYRRKSLCFQSNGYAIPENFSFFSFDTPYMNIESIPTEECSGSIPKEECPFASGGNILYVTSKFLEKYSISYENGNIYTLSRDNITMNVLYNINSYIGLSEEITGEIMEMIPISDYFFDFYVCSIMDMIAKFMNFLNITSILLDTSTEITNHVKNMKIFKDYRIKVYISTNNIFGYERIQ